VPTDWPSDEPGEHPATSAPSVLILSLVFPPDSVSTAQLMGELAVELQARGCRVGVITTTPHYNLEPSVVEAQPLRRWWGRVVQRSNYRGIPVFHTLMPRRSASLVGRGLAWLTFHVLSLLVGWLGPLRWQVIVAPSPPLSIGACAWLLTLRRRSRYIYNVQEIYPDLAISLGLLRNKALIRSLLTLERFVYARAAAVTVIAPRMRERLLAKGVPATKLKTIANCTEAVTLQPLPKANGFALEHGLADRFVVSYAGNMGPAQGLERLLDAAALLASEPAIRFLLIGDGIARAGLARRVDRDGLDNVTLLAQQPYARMAEIYGASDLSLVAQASGSASEAVPSKVYRIMTCGRPVLAVTDPASDLATLVREAEAGWVVSPDDPQAVAEVIQAARRRPDLCRSYGESGRRYVLAHHTTSAMGEAYFRLITSVAAGDSRTA
jgi:colanic acid biosynthesis glycosyl transferase WcaI